MSIIICDLDGTLCDTTHRQHFMQQRPKQWDAFYAGIAYDPIHDWCIELLRALQRNGHRVILMSGRPDQYREVSETWLFRNCVNYVHLYMRRKGDHRPDTIVKGELFMQMCTDHGITTNDVLICIDDRQCVVDMWRSMGLTCLQCAKGDF